MHTHTGVNRSNWSCENIEKTLAVNPYEYITIVKVTRRQSRNSSGRIICGALENGGHGLAGVNILGNPPETKQCLSIFVYRDGEIPPANELSLSVIMYVCIVAGSQKRGRCKARYRFTVEKSKKPAPAYYIV
jgi:hypothetical protein